MKKIAICKKDCHDFKKGNQYEIYDIYSIFEKNDFISLKIIHSNTSDDVFRFRLNKSLEYIDDYIGVEEYYFYDYFYILQEERKMKLLKLN